MLWCIELGRRHVDSIYFTEPLACGPNSINGENRQLLDREGGPLTESRPKFHVDRLVT